MSKHASLPTGSNKRRGAPRGPQGDPEHLREPPRPPDGVSEGVAAAWGELWQEPVARFWAPADGVLVLRLIRLRERLDDEGGSAPLGLFAAVLALERVLYLTPTARRDRLKAAVAEPPPAVAGNGAPASSSSSRRPSARERERLLRG